MNKYLEKIAEMRIYKDTALGKVKQPEPIKAPGSKMIHGAKTLFRQALLKKAQIVQTVKTLKGEPEVGGSTNFKHDALNTGIIAGLGAAAGKGAMAIANKYPKMFNPELGRSHNLRSWALMGGAGLVADYAGIKLNKAINKNVQ